MRKNLTKRERIKKYNDFKNVFKKAKQSEVKGLKILFVENNLSWNRIAIVTGRGYKRAVKRNRVKRHIREIYRKIKDTLNTGFDIIFIPYGNDYNYTERAVQIKKVLRVCRILL